MSKQVVSFRLDPDTFNWLKDYAVKHGTSPLTVVGDLVEAFRGQRLVLFSEPVPQIINEGCVASCPVLVCLEPA